jgi:hypothetical protein
MSSLASSYQEDPGIEKQVAHAEIHDSVVGDVTIGENAIFPEGGTQAWMVVIGVWVILKIQGEYNDSITDSHSFLVQFSTFGYTTFFPTCALFAS